MLLLHSALSLFVGYLKSTIVNENTYTSCSSMAEPYMRKMKLATTSILSNSRQQKMWFAYECFLMNLNPWWLHASIQELRRAGLKIDCFGLHENADRTSGVALPITLNKPLSCPITVLCNDICAAMKKNCTLVRTEGMSTRKWSSHSSSSSSYVP